MQNLLTPINNNIQLTDNRNEMKSIFNSSYFRKPSKASTGGLTGGLTGGVRGGLTGGLEKHNPFIHNNLSKNTGGLENFYKIRQFSKIKHVENSCSGKHP